MCATDNGNNNGNGNIGSGNGNGNGAHLLEFTLGVLKTTTLS